MNSTALPSLTVPLGDTAHQLAQQFAAEQMNPEKGVRVYLNTLAVWAVYCYLKWLKYEPELSTSDSWHSGMRAMFDVADLMLPNLGKIECRPVLPGETAIILPPEVMQNRIGYLAVKFGDRATSTEFVNLQEAQLIGFAPVAANVEPPEELQITELQSLDTLLEYLDQLEGALSAVPNQTPTHLTSWLQNVFQASWQTVEQVLIQQTPTLASRLSAVRRAKCIELRTVILVLIITIQPENQERLGIQLQLCAVNPQIVLPFQLRLQVLTAMGEVFREILAKETDTFMQYQFSGYLEEQFSIRVTLGDDHWEEAFVV